MSELIRPRFILLDSSQWGRIARDRYSRNSADRKQAARFMDLLVERGFVPLLSWHQIEELLRHRNDALVEDRVAFIRSLPMVAWIAAGDGSNFIGGVVDVLVFEADAALRSPAGDCLAVRDLVGQKLIRVGSGEEAFSAIVDEWRMLRPFLWRREQKEREIIAISRSADLIDPDTKVASLIEGQLRLPADRDATFKRLTHALAAEVKTRGDKRIPDAADVAARFYQEVRREGEVVIRRAASPALAILLGHEIDASEITADTTLGDITDLATFRRKLRVSSRYLKTPWPEIKTRVRMEQIPSWLIQETLRKFAQDQPERKGSELGDGYLLCLAAYADITCVDRRMSENVRRARRGSPVFAQLVRKVLKVGRYQDIPDTISAAI